jgi:hypothetical protein
MTEEQIFEIAKTCGIGDNKYEICICWKDELLKFAEEIRKCGWDDGFEYATEIHTDEINLLREELEKLGKVL